MEMTDIPLGKLSCSVNIVKNKDGACQRKVRSSGFVQNEKFRFLPAGSQRHDSLTWSARGRAQAEMQSRGDGVGSASNRHKPSFNGRKPCGGLSCRGCLLKRGKASDPKLRLCI